MLEDEVIILRVAGGQVEVSWKQPWQRGQGFSLYLLPPLWLHSSEGGRAEGQQALLLSLHYWPPGKVGCE